MRSLWPVLRGEMLTAFGSGVIRHCMFVSGGHEVVMWLPEKAVKEDDEDEDMELDS